MQTLDEVTNMRIIFDTESSPPSAAERNGNSQPAEPATEADRAAGGAKTATGPAAPGVESLPPLPPRVMSEEQALRELPAFPIYFASSYSLVKPYVAGFDANLLDAPSLKHVRIDTSWQPPKSAPVAWIR
jgi:hypothetical protein